MAINFSKEDKEKLRQDKSEIYTKRTEESYAEYVKELKGKDKGRYFADYYLRTVIIGFFVFIALIFFIRNAVANPPQIVLSVAIDGDAIEDTDLEDFARTVEEELGLDTSKEKVNVFISSNDKELQTFLYTGEVDIVISTEDGFKKWAEGGYFMEPGEYSQLSFYNNYPEDEKYYSTFISAEDIRNSENPQEAKPSDDTEYNYGIYLTGADIYQKELKGLVQKPVAGISAATRNIDYAVPFIKYMTGRQ